jgi:hypothetical protein
MAALDEQDVEAAIRAVISIGSNRPNLVVLMPASDSPKAVIHEV